VVAADTATAVVTGNPFIGPVPFPRRSRAESRFFGRQHEIQELVSYVLSQPLVLLYSPSGAGKSSLVNAGVIPELEDVHDFQVLPVARVRGRTDVERSDTLPCFYTYQAILEMDPTVPLDAAATWTLADFLARYPRPEVDGRPAARVLVFDQFEEILAIYSSRSPEHQRTFFLQVRDALRADPLLRVVWLVREDRVSQLEAFSDLLPYGLGLRYRLDHLTREAALQAVVETARGSAKPFSADAAEILVGELMKTRAEVRPGHFELIDGTRVEPVQLQVVCHSIWEEANPGEITADELPRFGDIEDVLAAYYDEVVSTVVASSTADEATLREWFSTRLVTAVRTRGTVFRGPTHTDDVIPIPNDVVDQLEARHVVRGEQRAEGGGRWYELVHDTFITPILVANVRWRARRERRALSWIRIAVPPVVVVLVALAGLRLPAAVVVPPVPPDSDPIGGTPLTGTVATGEQDVHPVHVDQGGVLAVGADEATGPAVRLGLRAPDGTVQDVGAADLDPGPGLRALRTDVTPGDYQLLVGGLAEDPVDYEVWLATGPELSTAADASTYDGELDGNVSGPLLLPGTGAPVDVTAHSEAFDTVLTVLPLGGSTDEDKLTNDDYGGDCGAAVDSSAAPGSADSGLTSTDSRLSVPTRAGEVYEVYVEPYSPGEVGSYTITTVAATESAPSSGQQLSQELPPLGSASVDLPDDAGEVGVQTPGGGAVELTVNPGRQPQVTECISPYDLAGARLALPPGPDRVLLVRNLASAPTTVVVTVT
jgi:hypothetical protein